MDTKAAVEQTFQEIWADIVVPNGEWDLEQVKRELYDYSRVMGEVSKTYAELTEGRVSYPNTSADVVISTVREIQQRACDECPRIAEKEKR